MEAAMRIVLMINRAEDPGDILLFLTGEEEIEDACRKLKLEADDLVNQDPSSVGPLVCIHLYSSLPPQQQQRIFDPAPPPRTPDGPAGRKVVVSTNIAETSVTIDGIVYVVDPGFSRQKVYNPRIRMESLLVSPISKASAQQRAGRAGRTRPRKYFRLYTEKELEDQTHPEILRSNLSNTVLELVKLGIKDLVKFDYVDAPAPETLIWALEFLNYLVALDNEGNLTPLGSIVAEFPPDPQLSKMLIVSPESKCSNEILTTTAMMSVPNVWLRLNNERREADTAKTQLTVPDGDLLTLLNPYNEYAQIRTGLGQITFHYVHLDKQIMLALNYNGRWNVLKSNSSLWQAKPNFMSRFAEISSVDFLCRLLTRKAGLHPSRGLDNQPEWAVFNEFVLTTRPYIRTASQLQVQWLSEFAPHLF